MRQGFNSILNNEERISAYRISQILEAYAEGNDKQLPPIRYAPQFGQIEDGRHRVFVAWILGIREIQADLVWVTPDQEEKKEEVKQETVEFFWDFEEVGNGEFVKNIWVEGMEVEGLNEFAQDNGIARARALVKKLAKKAGKKFVEGTDKGLAQDFAYARICAHNANR